MDKKTLVIAYGGVSPEHEVSVLTAMQAFASLKDDPVWNLIPLYISKSGRWYTGSHLLKLDHYQDLNSLLENSMPCSFAHDDTGRPVLRETGYRLFRKSAEYRVDTVLIAFHGGGGENGSFQGLCEMYNVPYTGCDVLSSAIGMDKVTAKALCRSHDIPVVDEHHFSEPEWETDRDSILEAIEMLGYPVVVKPAHLGSSIGVNLASDRPDLISAIELALRYDEQLLVERAVQPLMEINCAVTGSADSYRSSVCERPVSGEEFLSFTDKYMGDSGESKGMASAARVIPADIPDELRDKIQGTSEQIFSLFQAAGVARLDFLVNADTLDFYFNEINTIPGSFSFYLWEESGTGFRELLKEMISQAISRHQKKNGRVQSYETNLLSQKAARGMKGIKK